jgi:hypothetical protein
MGQWERVAQDDGADAEGGRAPDLATPAERARAACTVLLMAGVGTAIGCAFVLLRRALGMDEA